MSLSTTVGTTLRLSVTFHDGETSLPVDPTKVSFVVKPPTGQPRTLAASRERLGVFIADFHIDAPGAWIVGADGSGEYAASVEDKVFVAEQLLQR